MTSGRDQHHVSTESNALANVHRLLRAKKRPPKSKVPLVAGTLDAHGCGLFAALSKKFPLVHCFSTRPGGTLARACHQAHVERAGLTLADLEIGSKLAVTGLSHLDVMLPGRDLHHEVPLV